MIFNDACKEHGHCIVCGDSEGKTCQCHAPPLMYQQQYHSFNCFVPPYCQYVSGEQLSGRSSYGDTS